MNRREALTALLCVPVARKTGVPVLASGVELFPVGVAGHDIKNGDIIWMRYGVHRNIVFKDNKVFAEQGSIRVEHK